MSNDHGPWSTGGYSFWGGLEVSDAMPIALGFEPILPNQLFDTDNVGPSPSLRGWCQVQQCLSRCAAGDQLAWWKQVHGNQFCRYWQLRRHAFDAFEASTVIASLYFLHRSSSAQHLSYHQLCERRVLQKGPSPSCASEAEPRSGDGPGPEDKRMSVGISRPRGFPTWSRLIGSKIDHESNIIRER